MTTGTALLEVRDVAFSYSRRGLAALRPRADRPVVDRLSLSVRRGRSVGIIGESGSGKTTVARLMLGFETPDRGAVLFDGQALTGTSLKRFRRQVQPVFQDPADSLDPRMRIADQLAQPLLVNDAPAAAEIDRRVRAALADVGLGGSVLRRFPHQLSGGQAQRVAIARALVLNPGVLICDEPVSALDVTIQLQILNLFKTLLDDGRVAIVLISHDLRAVSYLCHETLVLHRGRVVEHGPTGRVLGDPAHAYTRSLVAAVPAAVPVP